MEVGKEKGREEEGTEEGMRKAAKSQSNRMSNREALARMLLKQQDQNDASSNRKKKTGNPK